MTGGSRYRRNLGGRAYEEGPIGRFLGHLFIAAFISIVVIAIFTFLGFSW